MAVSSFTFRISGNVALENNLVKSFLSNWTSLHLSDLPDSNLSFRALYDALKSQVEGLLPWTSTTQVNPSADPTAAAVDASAAAIVITGLVAYDDNTSKSFAFELRDDGAVYNHTGAEGIAAWEDLAGDSVANTKLDEMFTSLYTSDGQAITVTIA